jgi:hypothetical protein
MGAIMSKQNSIQDLVFDAIQSDDSFTLSDETRLRAKYNGVSDSEREVVDYIFVQLCGYSLKTLLKKRYKDETTDNK